MCMIQKGVVNWVEGGWAEIVTEPGTPSNLPCVLFPDLREGDRVTIQIGTEQSGEKAAMERIAGTRSGLNRYPV